MKRRFFLKNVLMFTGGGFLASYARPLNKAIATAREGVIKGRVMSKGNPIDNVIVSDF